MVHSHLVKLFPVDPLMQRTFAAGFSPAHLEHFALRMPLEVALANLYFHVVSYNYSPDRALKVTSLPILSICAIIIFVCSLIPSQVHV